MTMPIDRQAEVMRLFHAERWKIGTIAAQLGLHHSAVRRVLQRNGVSLPPPRRPTKIDAYRAMIVETLEKYPTLRSTRLLEMVRQRGYTGQISTLRQVVATLRPHGAKEAYLRLTTLPGEQGQVDWADFGEVEVGRTRRRLMAFVMVLSWSRERLEDNLRDLSQRLRRGAYRASPVRRAYIPKADGRQRPQRQAKEHAVLPRAGRGRDDHRPDPPSTGESGATSETGSNETILPEVVAIELPAEVNAAGPVPITVHTSNATAVHMKLDGLDLGELAGVVIGMAAPRRRDAIPAEGVEIRREQVRGVEPAACDALPDRLAEQLSVDLTLPEDLQRIALGVVLKAGETDQAAVTRLRRRLYPSTRYCRERTRTMSPVWGIISAPSPARLVQDSGENGGPLAPVQSTPILTLSTRAEGAATRASSRPCGGSHLTAEGPHFDQRLRGRYKWAPTHPRNTPTTRRDCHPSRCCS